VRLAGELDEIEAAGRVLSGGSGATNSTRASSASMRNSSTAVLDESAATGQPSQAETASST